MKFTGLFNKKLLQRSKQHAIVYCQGNKHKQQGCRHNIKFILFWQTINDSSGLMHMVEMVALKLAMDIEKNMNTVN